MAALILPSRVALILSTACSLSACQLVAISSGKLSESSVSVGAQTSLVTNGVSWELSCSSSTPCEYRWAVVDKDAEASLESLPYSPQNKSEKVIASLEESGSYDLVVQARSARGLESTALRKALEIKLEALPRSATQITRVNLSLIAQKHGQSVVEYLKNHLGSFAPKTFVEGDRELFTSYNAATDSQWANNYLRNFDFSGVGWDAVQAGTLVTTQHLVMANHFQRSGPIVFHDRDGRRVVRNIVALASMPGGLDPDVTVGKLDEPVPEGVAVYPVIDGRQVPSANLVGAPFLLSDQVRRIFYHQIAGFSAHGVYGMMVPGLPTFMSKYLVGGDSGNPSWVVVEGHLVLLETHTYASYGNGPYYGHPDVMDGVQALIDSF